MRPTPITTAPTLWINFKNVYVIAALFHRPIDKWSRRRQTSRFSSQFRFIRRAQLANSAQARKRARQAKKRRAHNMHMRSAMRTSVKKIINAIASGDKDSAQAAFRASVPVIDSMATKGLMHKNKAARHKSRLNSQIKSM
jgi:small subunit ribosomal protein S20